MLYKLTWGNGRVGFSRAQVESWDGVVVKATPSFYWAVDKSIEEVLWWAEQHGMKWQVSATAARWPSLSTPPADAAVFKKVSP